MAMTRKAQAKLEVLDPKRALLARMMATYLNHLRGSVEENCLTVNGETNAVLRADEGVLEARLAGLFK